ncbi:hypothetical protein BofuT4_uP123690.1 [Botrytis cinerea T4]|uniref:Uncharacterized protein n=1 Tax=Botryotinia fuckeliana (strain T4) TaxID=999810 RepID=G2YP02_BOTF4|nr:hypothetical protein BofuT4_uP123690.1 [Botrytis cinerea T4]
MIASIQVLLINLIHSIQHAPSSKPTQITQPTTKFKLGSIHPKHKAQIADGISPGIFIALLFRHESIPAPVPASGCVGSREVGNDHPNGMNHG